MRVAVVGSGVAGLSAAWALTKAGAQVVVYEKDAHVGGHAFTFRAQPEGVDVDLGFMVFNTVTYPNMLEFFDELEVAVEQSDMSFSVSVPACEWGSTGLGGLFAYRRNALRPAFWLMLREMLRFQDDVLAYLRRVERDGAAAAAAGGGGETLGQFLAARGYSGMFRDCYLVPVCASIWSCGEEGVLGFSAFSVLSFLRNHHMLQIFGRPQWLTVKGRSHVYVQRAVKKMEEKGAMFKTKTAVTSVRNNADGKVEVEDATGGCETFDAVAMALHAPDALPLLGSTATQRERDVLSAFQYSTSDIYLHRDKSFMPRRRAAWSAWNFRGTVSGGVCVTYWLNTLQNLGNTGEPFLVTLNPESVPRHVHHRWLTSHPIPSPAAEAAAWKLPAIQGERGIWFCGAYQGYGFHEDGFKAGMVVGHSILGEVARVRANVPQMQLQWWEYAARFAVIGFLNSFIRLGSLQMLEVGGTVHRFGAYPSLVASARAPAASSGFKEWPVDGWTPVLNGMHTPDAGTPRLANGHASHHNDDDNDSSKRLLCNGGSSSSGGGGSGGRSGGDDLDCRLIIHNPAFYWKVATRADLGLADAFIDGDFSCSRGPAGLLKFLELLVLNRDRTKQPGRTPPKAKGWWSPALVTATIGSALLYVRHLLRFNNLTNARRNISNHYDLSNEMFSMFLDSTMTYSCAIFKNPVEPLEEAQLRKLRRLIAKAQITASCKVLEIGFGWGSMAMEMVRLTGCHVTGITLSQQQLLLATERVKEAGLQDHVEFVLCDYRRLPGKGRFDRIVSCEMLEAVGHEYLGDFFHHCDRLLKMDGLLVVQVITTPEERYEEYRRTSDFIKEYIFPGCCVPSLAALVAASTSSSTFSVEHVENIGPHYAPTLLRWLDNFDDRKEEIMRMGFGPKFVRMWEYYFVYCAAGFKTRTLGDLQIVFSRPGNVPTLGDTVVGERCAPLFA